MIRDLEEVVVVLREEGEVEAAEALADAADSLQVAALRAELEERGFKTKPARLMLHCDWRVGAVLVRPAF